MNTRYFFALATGGLALAATALAPATPAYACGGFFCDQAQPVNQAAERIIFSQGEDGAITAIIQIQYQGPAEEFAWMLPVHGSPDIQVSSNAAFDRLQQATNPQYLLNTIIEGSCRDDASRFGGPTADSAASDGGAAGPPEAGGVTVVNEGSVGPFDFVVISVDPSVTEASDVAVEWLQMNGYQIDQFGADRLEPYLEGGMNLLAFRLTKGNDAGAIRPVVLGFGTGLASIPIRPTAVAAVDDMGVMVWVLGSHRAVPVNYRALELNEALIDWLNPNRNYNDVVTEAANQAGGQGFVTEMAGPAEPLADTIFQPWERARWESLSQLSNWERQDETLMEVLQSFGQFDGMREVIRAHVPLPAGVDADELLGCLWCNLIESHPETGAIEGFDPAAFVAAVQDSVIDPMEQTRDLFTRSPMVTRLYTTMSADEMTLDPAFDFNADLPSVDVLRQADRIIECSPSISQFEAPWRVVLPNGQVVRGNGNAWPFEVGDEGMPANARIRRVGTEGEGEVIVDNVAAISAALSDHNETIPVHTDGGGCSASGGAGGTAFGVFGLLAFGLFLARRRRS